MDRAGAFRAQAASDLDVFALLSSLDGVPACHGLHYLQMATEKLGRALRASGEQHGAEERSHVAIVKALRLLRNRREAADVLFDGDFEAWRAYVDRLLPLVASVERLAPAVAGNRENPEYPWEIATGDWIAPSRHRFDLARRVRGSEGARLVALLRRILERYERLFQ